jgi:hypothetical protein
MKSCPNCQNENLPDAMFCRHCGEDISEVQPTGAVTAVASTPNPDPIPVPEPDAGPALEPVMQPGLAGNVLCTLSWPGDDGNPEVALPLHDNSEAQIHRTGSQKALQNVVSLALPGTGVSNTPVRVKTENGKITVEDSGTTNGFYVARKVTAADGPVEVSLDKGEYLIFGETFVFLQ